MGRHTKFEDDLASADDGPLDEETVEEPVHSRRLSWVTKVPLLPAIAGLGAIGVVTAAWSTSQISLNFAGGQPSGERPQAGAQDRADARRGAEDRISRSRQNAVVVSFRATSRSATGFTATATIKNGGTRAVKGWTLLFRISDARVQTASNAVLVKPGAAPTLRSPANAPALAPGQSVRVTFTAQGKASKPTVCSFNGAPCTVA